MTTKTGTPYFISFNAACNYYKSYGDTPDTVKRKISNGEIHIGKPPLKPGQSLEIIPDENRYMIIEK